MEEIPRYDDCTYQHFYQHHLRANKPAVFGPAILPPSWQNDVSIDVLKREFGDIVVPVAHCEQKEYDSQPKTEMKFAEYLEYVQTRTESDPILYVKDFHHRKTHPNLFETPMLFQDDFLNAYNVYHGLDDFFFMYCGVKSSWTPLHTDVFQSYSWSSNILGAKEWIFISPDQKHLLYDKTKSHRIYDVRNVDPELFPDFAQVKLQRIVQEEGESIFVPSGWYHQVENLSDLTLSVNCNWVNSCNISWMKSSLMEEMGNCEKAIADLKKDMGDEWEPHIQLMLKAQSGMDLKDFRDLLEWVQGQLEAKKGPYWDIIARLGVDEGFAREEIRNSS